MMLVLKIGHFLFDRRQQKGRWLFVLASLPFLIFALIGREYGAFPLYIIPAVICIVQLFYSTMFSWIIIFSLYFIGSSVYVFLLIGDIVKIIKKVRPEALLDFDDSVVFILLVIILVVVTLGLLRYRPRLKERKLKNEL